MQTLPKRHPRFWRIYGNEENCELYVDESVTYNGQRSCLLKHSGTESTDRGVMIQTMGGFGYRNKRLRFSAKIKTESIEAKSGLFVNLLDSQPAIILKDDMIDREISGTTEWTELIIVIDVPNETRYINFGAMIKGQGSLWIADPAISEVGKDVPVTENAEDSNEILKGPTNFELEASEVDAQKPKDWLFHTSADKDVQRGLRQEDNRQALWISSNVELKPKQGEKSSIGGQFSQTFNCFQWREKRVCFSADIKCKDVSDWCGLMMWVRGTGAKTLAFTTMYDIGLCGDTDWQNWSVILDVPPVACRVIVSATLRGNGTVYFSNLSFKEVPPEIATTDRSSRAKNLNFAE